jgi:hypothetical protein
LVILSKSKPELIEAAIGLDDRIGMEPNFELLERIMDAANLAQEMAHMTRAAEIRLMVAFHNVYDEDGNRRPA